VQRTRLSNQQTGEETMKRQLVVSVVLFGLAGVISANLPKTQAGNQGLPDSIKHPVGTLIADGDPFPPPFPPSCVTNLSPQFIADGDPFPPPFPPKTLGGLQVSV
jgi:hypothetical protein